MDEHGAQSPITPTPAAQPGAGPTTPTHAPAGAVDVERLADKVYALLLAEARLKYARGQPRRERRT